MKLNLRRFKKILIIISGVFGFTLSAYSQTQSTVLMNTMSNPNTKKTANEKSWALNLDLSRTRSLTDQKNASFEESNDFDISYSYKLPQDYTLGIKSGYSQDTQNSQDSSASDIQIFAGKKISPNTGTADYQLKLTNVIPASKDSKERQDLQYGIGLSAKSESKPGVFLNGNANIEARISLSRYFHKYDIAYDSTQNNQYSSTQGIKLTALLSKKAQLSFDVAHRNTQTYLNTQGEKYMHTEEFSYDMSKDLSLYVGHTLGGVGGVDVVKANGDSNVNLISDDNSRIYLGLTFNL